MSNNACKFIPWSQPPGVTPRAIHPYRQGDLQCEVLTGHGQHCGNAQGTTRCRDYCQRVMGEWESKLLPVAMQLARHERAETNVNGLWVPVTEAFSNAEAWEQIAQHVDVELMAYSEPHLMYMGRVTIKPATGKHSMLIDIVVPDANTEALSAIRVELERYTSKECSIVFNERDGVLTIVAPLDTHLRVGNAVTMGLRFLLMDVIARHHQPFSFNVRYVLPGIAIKDVEADDGTTLQVVRGVRFGGVDVFRPAVRL